jgi:hypothetical protein
VSADAFPLIVTTFDLHYLDRHYLDRHYLDRHYLDRHYLDRHYLDRHYENGASPCSRFPSLVPDSWPLAKIAAAFRAHTRSRPRFLPLENAFPEPAPIEYIDFLPRVFSQNVEIVQRK